MLEIACFEITSAETALNSVADRIEFCSDIQSGGLTPDLEEFRYLKSKYHTPIHVMIRPSAGSFLYSEGEFEQMKISLSAFRDAGADGFVFGVLDVQQRIDVVRNRILLDLADGKPCVFHRAVDRTRDLFRSAELIMQLGFREILTSGGKRTALEGKENLKKLVELFPENILIGGSVRSGNISELIHTVKSHRFHSSAILSYETFANPNEIKLMKECTG
ncbi:copper homeostasis protein CutC [Weeksellaceae bacterium A-14]